MNPELDKLHPYPFEKLSALFADSRPPSDLRHIALSIGEPKHPTPALITEAMIKHIDGLSVYPTTAGIPALRKTIADWLDQRFQLAGNINAETQILPVNGTREALFAFAQAIIDRKQDPLVVMPNPFYQIYEGAALLAGAQMHLLNCDAENDFMPDFDNVPSSVWTQCQLLYLCSPGNPSGAVIDAETLSKLIQLAHEYNFIIAADECYSEIYFEETLPPAGLLQAAVAAGYNDFSRCVVFHSLSKRSNAPGLRSGFVAGDAAVLKTFLRYRTYHGCAMPTATQAASIAAWSDENHVVQNRRLYREKFTAVLDILKPVMNVSQPEASFYLWAETPIADTEFAKKLYEQWHVTVLPGSYLARDTKQGNPGLNRVRMALVAPLDECVEAARRIRQLIESLS
ncbi:N-succinyl-L,L-diaminopimelate aminotransferase alternative [Methylophaga frappieri]|uniref:N-succinyl-L,L-diaminopimelate aminotransferase alternative n=1 Tax=Methylophaga frappieri (strain ATCC BAA-2434 / DSM 25690 / JAM7) TaxID=754477 RepID=I1YG15_METFJ|nr:succinyldiaminopimelate transaminase [Methylophaga frappieri]AFJ01858.1 N-succinyl-L,L-diaminopimelate aminotransferase alternative [Methylophaga frappieri]